MSLKDDIKTAIDSQKKTKSKILNGVRTEILEMIEAGIPLNKQIELILKNNVVDKITITEYRRILELDFGYTGRNKKQKKVVETKNQFAPQQPQPTQLKPQNPAISAKSILSQNIDLFAT